MTFPKNKTIAVLGGLGFIGSHLCRALVNSGNNILVYGKTDSSLCRVRDIEDKIKIVKGGADCPNAVFNAIKDADILIHLIHSTVPQKSMDNAVLDVVSNVAFTVNWASKLNLTSIKKVIYISSGGTVYGVANDELITETHQTNPISSYGITKLMIEKYISMYASMHGIKYFIIRPSNVYGESQRLDKGQGLIGTLIDHAIKNKPLSIFGKGDAVRDYLHVDDLVKAICKLITYQGSHTVFNVGYGKGHSVVDILHMLENSFGHILDVNYFPARNFDVPSNILNCELLKKELGWEPEVSLEDGLARVLGYSNDK